MEINDQGSIENQEDPETGIILREGQELFPEVGEEQVPQDDTISIADVEMNNFIKQKGLNNEYGDVELMRGEGFVINYNVRTESFLITILDQPFSIVRLRAEQELLFQLGISEEESCQLDVSITTPRFINPTEAGGVFDLSYCQNY